VSVYVHAHVAESGEEEEEDEMAKVTVEEE